MSGLSRRAISLWLARAKSSLPVPVSLLSTIASVPATCRGLLRRERALSCPMNIYRHFSSSTASFLGHLSAALRLHASLARARLGVRHYVAVQTIFTNFRIRSGLTCQPGKINTAVGAWRGKAWILGLRLASGEYRMPARINSHQLRNPCLRLVIVYPNPGRCRSSHGFDSESLIVAHVAFRNLLGFFQRFTHRLGIVADIKHKFNR